MGTYIFLTHQFEGSSVRGVHMEINPLKCFKNKHFFFDIENQAREIDNWALEKCGVKIGRRLMEISWILLLQK